MKRLTTLAMMLFLVGLAIAGTEEGGTQKITMNVASALDLTIPSDLSWGDLSIGDNHSANQTCNVKSTDSYDLKIKSSPVEDTLAVFMPKKYDTAEDTFYHAGSFISDTLQWKGGDEESYTDISASYGTVLNDASATIDDGTDTSLNYNVNVGYADRPITAANTAYAIKLQVFATQTISR